MEKPPFRDLLRRAMNVAGVTQRELSRRSGKNISTISFTLQGKTWGDKYPPLDDIEAYARALDMPVAQLRGDEPMPGLGVAEQGALYVVPRRLVTDAELLLKIGAEPFSGDDTVAPEDFAASARTGQGNLIPQNYDDMRPKRGKQPRKPKPDPHIFKLRISGGCMKDTVKDGEIVWFDTWLPREPIALVLAVRDEHEAHIKRLVDRSGERWLEADDGWNEQVDERWRILAVAFTAQRNLIFG